MGADVYHIQYKLRDLKYYFGKVDGRYGEIMKKQ
ncbi:peptidoglycan-binding protein [Clostridium sp.]